MELAAEIGGRGPYNAGVRRRVEILEAAVRVFGSHGYRGSTLKQIADDVGITTAGVLRYFSKEELLTEVLKHWDDNQPVLRNRRDGVSWFRQFPDLMRFHLENRGFLELFLTFATEASDPTHPAHDFLVERHRRSAADMRQNLVAAADLGEIPPMSDADAEYEARAFTAMLDGFELQWLLDPSVDLVGLVETYTEQAIARWQRGPVAVHLEGARAPAQ